MTYKLLKLIIIIDEYLFIVKVTSISRTLWNHYQYLKAFKKHLFYAAYLIAQIAQDF